MPLLQVDTGFAERLPPPPTHTLPIARGPFREPTNIHPPVQNRKLNLVHVNIYLVYVDIYLVYVNIYLVSFNIYLVYLNCLVNVSIYLVYFNICLSITSFKTIS